MKPKLEPSSTVSSRQLELEISTPDAQSASVESNTRTSPPIQSYSSWVTPWTLSLALAIGALVIMTVTISTADDNQTGLAKRPEQFRLIDSEISVPERRRFPPIDLPRDGQVIQVGIFTKLSGAESKQIALTHLGLDPYVQKRVTENGLQYAVLLGPLSSKTHSEALATLSENNYSYFHRPKRGS